MSKSAHDRALDVAARRYLTWQALAGRPPLRGVMDAKAWPDWAHGPMFEEIERRAHELARAQSPDDQAFLAALHRLAADQLAGAT